MPEGHVGIDKSYIDYVSWYDDVSYTFSFEPHNKYWTKYTKALWDQDCYNLKDTFKSIYDFQDYYNHNVLFYIDYAQAVSLQSSCIIPRGLNDIPDIPDIPDMQGISRSLSVDDVLLRPTGTIAQVEKGKSKNRSCCGFGFFQRIENVGQSIRSVIKTGSTVVTETGEELSKVVSSSQGEFQRQKFLFYRKVDHFMVDNREKQISLSKDDLQYKC